MTAAPPRPASARWTPTVIWLLLPVLAVVFVVNLCVAISIMGNLGWRAEVINAVSIITLSASAPVTGCAIAALVMEDRRRPGGAETVRRVGIGVGGGGLLVATALVVVIAAGR